MRVELCAIAKNEHLYINEWVSHYIKLGFDRITIYDNDNVDSPYIGDFIEEKYKNKVNIINVRGIHKKAFQHECYNNFYKSNNFDWVFFCDIDEFLTGIDNVKDFLKQKRFNQFAQIRVKWLLFGDDDKITRDMSKNVYGYFRKPILDNRLSNQGKAFIRGNIKLEIHSCHFVENLFSCYPNGVPCSSTNMDLLNYDNQSVYLFHYMTKTLDEFIKQKLNRGDAVWEKRAIDFNYYWKINKKTKEKIEYIHNLGLE